MSLEPVTDAGHTYPSQPPPYRVCTFGIGGDWRILEWSDTTQTVTQYLALFPKGGPYGYKQIICIVPGDHPIMALGKGKDS